MIGIELIPKPYKLANGKWVPRIIRRIYVGEEISETKIEIWDKKFDTEAMVNDFLRAEIKVMKLKKDG